MASIQSSAYTFCEFRVDGDFLSAAFDQNRYWQGYENPPPHIGAPTPQPSTFTHKADFIGSIGGLAYHVRPNDFDPQHIPVKWIIAWSNERGMLNKVYTKILRHDEPIIWHTIKTYLDRSTNVSTDDLYGFHAEAEIARDGDTPPMFAKLTAHSHMGP